MKKTFPLDVPGLKPPRVIEAIKHEVRKYLKRERRKTLPDGVDYCDFACRVGPDEESSKPTHVAELTAAIDHASAEGWPAVYIEVIATPGYRAKRKPEPDGSAAAAD